MYTHLSRKSRASLVMFPQDLRRVLDGSRVCEYSVCGTPHGNTVRETAPTRSRRSELQRVWLGCANGASGIRAANRECGEISAAGRRGVTGT